MLKVGQNGFERSKGFKYDSSQRIYFLKCYFIYSI